MGDYSPGDLVADAALTIDASWAAYTLSEAQHGNDTTLTHRATTANRKPTPQPMIMSDHPSGVVRYAPLNCLGANSCRRDLDRDTGKTGRGWTDEGAAWRASSVGNNTPSSENCPAVVKFG